MLGQKVFLDFYYEVTLNTLGDTEAYQCDTEMNLKYDYDFYNLLATKNEKEFNCTVPFHPPTTSKLNGRLIEICNNSRNGNRALENYEALRTGSLSHEHVHDHEHEPCAMMDIIFGLPHIDENNNSRHEAYIKLYLKETVKVKTMILYYDVSTLGAELSLIHI